MASHFKLEKKHIEEDIKQLKLEGNNHFQRRDYLTAITYYTKGIEHSIYKSDYHNNKALIEIRQSLLLNRCKAYFKIGNNKDALLDSANCIKLCPDNKLSFKAHFTRSEIYKHLGDHENALKHCNQIINVCHYISVSFIQALSRWNNSRQQDAEEFVGWLLDALHKDLNLNLIYYELTESNGRNDEIVANEHWKSPLKHNQSIIVDVFQGQYKSTLKCPSCDNISSKFDTFSALTLPIPDKDIKISVRCLVFSEDPSKYPYSLTVNVSSKALLTELTDIASIKLNGYLQCKTMEIRQNNDNDNDEKRSDDPIFSSDNLLVCRILYNRFVKYWSPGRPLKVVIGKNASQNIYIYRVQTTTIVQRKENDLVQVRMNFFYKLYVEDSNSSNSDAEYDNNEDQSVFFGHPMVFDVSLKEFTGNKMYQYFKQRFPSYSRKIANKPSMWLIKEHIYHEIRLNDEQITFDIRNAATIYVEFTEYEYKLILHIDRPLLISGYLRIHKYESLINRIIPNDIKLLIQAFYPKYNDFTGSIDGIYSDKKPKNDTDLHECLKLYTEMEILDDVIWKCSSCYKTAAPFKELSLWRLPQILIIHLKRFINKQGYVGGNGKKNNLKVTVPINGLDLTQYVSDTINLDEMSIPKYDLFAIVNHSGNLESGVYYSCVQTDFSTQIANFYQHHNEVDEPKWNLFHDDRVQKIAIDDLQHYTEHGYLLFYKRRENI